MTPTVPVPSQHTTYTTSEFIFNKELSEYSWRANNMYNNVDNQLAEELAARKLRTKLEKKLALVEQYDIDTFVDGTIFKFSRQFAADPQRDYSAGKYNYAALKAVGKWYLTGSIHGFARGTWDEFVLALVSGDFPVDPSQVIIIQQDDLTDISLRDYRASISE